MTLPTGGAERSPEKRPMGATGDRESPLLAGGRAVLAVMAVRGAWVSPHLSAVVTGQPRPTLNPLRLVVGL